MMDSYTKLIFIALFMQLFGTILCDVNFEWKYLSEKQLVEIEISTNVESRNPSKTYVAVAFATTRSMEDADGYVCTTKGLKSIVIQNKYTEPKILKGLQGAELIKVGVRNGFLNCTFTRRMSVTKSISGNEPYVFDFINEQYYVLTASGGLKDDGGLLYHMNSRDITQNKISFATGIPVDDTTCSSQADKNCLREPPDCSSQDPDCMFFSLKQVGNRFEIELSGGHGNGERYMAVAFASSDMMVDADLYYCTGNELRSAVIRNREERPTDLNDTDVTVMKASTEDGVGKCRFFRAACVIKEVRAGVRKKFDFMNDELYILVAAGDMTQDGKLTNHGAHHRFTTTGALKFGGDQLVNYQCAQVDFVPETVKTASCGISKYCVRFPRNCNPSSPNCTFLTLMAAESGDSLKVELSGGIGNGKEYIAIGFSENEHMEDVDVYYCDGFTVRSAVIDQVYSKPITLAKSKAVTRAEATTTNGIGHCSFKRPVCVNKRITGGVNHAFDLSKTAFHIFLARGEMTEDGGLTHHDEKLIHKLDVPFLDVKSSYECVDNTERDLSVFETEDCLLGLKDCVRSPSDCPITQPECAYFSYQQDGDDITMELSGGIGNGKGYVAVAFSKTNNLDDAYVYYCDGLEMKSGFRKNGTYQNVAVEGGIVRLETTTKGGVGRCIFSEPGCAVRNDGRANVNLNFFKTDFYIFTEVGVLNAAGQPLLIEIKTTIKRRLGKITNKNQKCGSTSIFTRASYFVIIISLLLKLLL